MASKDRPDRPAKEKIEPRHHVYVRLPFNRGDFVDPPPINWDEKKSEALWAIISVVSQTEINWNELASKFHVSVEFILQMASYLTERHTSQLRAQMRKVAVVKGSSAPSPVPGAEPAGYPLAEAMRRTGSGGGRAPSALSTRRDSPLPRNGGRSSPTPAKGVPPGRPQISRNSSGGTAVASGKPQSRLNETHRRRLSIITPGPATPTQQEADPSSPNPVDSARSTSPAPSSSSSSTSSSAVESRIIRRPPRFQTNDGGHDLADDEDAEPAFLPFRPKESTSTSASSGQDLGATLRGDDRDGFGRRVPKPSGRSHREQLLHHSQTSDSSTSSAAMVRRPTGDRNLPGPLSPRRTAELAGRSPSGKGKSREGSDGTPSMGSSFSDLDDASVTQSALEEALASRMQDGTIGSRMSTIGQAIRSRYLPGGAGPGRQ